MRFSEHMLAEFMPSERVMRYVRGAVLTAVIVGACFFCGAVVRGCVKIFVVN